MNHAYVSGRNKIDTKKNTRPCPSFLICSILVCRFVIWCPCSVYDRCVDILRRKSAQVWCPCFDIVDSMMPLFCLRSTLWCRLTLGMFSLLKYSLCMLMMVTLYTLNLMNLMLILACLYEVRFIFERYVTVFWRESCIYLQSSNGL